MTRLTQLQTLTRSEKKFLGAENDAIRKSRVPTQLPRATQLGAENDAAPASLYASGPTITAGQGFVPLEDVTLADIEEALSTQLYDARTYQDEDDEDDSMHSVYYGSEDKAEGSDSDYSGSACAMGPPRGVASAASSSAPPPRPPPLPPPLPPPASMCQCQFAHVMTVVNISKQ